MDILTILPNAGVVVAIIALTQVVKTVDKAGLLAGWYVLIPLVLGVALGVPVSFAAGQTMWYQIVLNCFLESAGAAFLWKIGRTVLDNAGPPAGVSQ